MANRVKWNEFETALLIDTFWQIEHHPSHKSELIASLSSDLRKMAINDGLEIDDKFRNINGISMQLSSIAHGFFPNRPMLTSSAVFDKMIALYLNDRYSFDAILVKARAKVNGEPSMPNDSKQIPSFKAWLKTNGHKKYSYDILMESLAEADLYLIKHRMSKGSIFEVKDPDIVYRLLSKLTGMRFYRIMNPKTAKVLDVAAPLYKKYLVYISSLSNEIATLQEESDHKEGKETTSIQPSPASNSIEALLKEHYQYGFKIDSMREIIRFRFLAEDKEISLPEDDDELKKQILACGILIDGRVFIKSDNTEQELNDIIKVIFESGVQAVYFEALFEQKLEWMSSHFITSEEMLKELLRKCATEYTYAKKFMMNSPKKTEKQIVTDEIKRVWGDKQYCSVDDLSERLPFIPKGNIWRVISGNCFFVLMSEAVYVDVDRLIITEQEEKDILEYVEKTCAERGFASLADIPMGDIFEQNYELTPLAIYNAIYNRLLVDKYQMKDKILTRGDTSLNAVYLLKQHLVGKEDCTFSEIAEMVVELTGSPNRQFAFDALYSCMVRVEKNRFVADKYVDFEVEQIDAALSDIITNHFCAIKDVTTFAMFPICGMPWNHYLLESFCFRFSGEFTLNVMNFNDKNAGIIVERNYNKSYVEMLAIAVAKSDVPLIPETVGQYLNRVGYLAKSKYGNLEMITEMAKTIREGE